MQKDQKLLFKCLALNNAVVESNHFKFIPDPSWKEYSYFTINDASSVKLNMSGAWTCVIANKPLENGVHHFSMKIKNGLDIISTFVCEDEKESQSPLYDVKSYNSFYAFDGSAVSEGTCRYSNIQVSIGEIIHSIYDFDNGVITFLRESTQETLGQIIISSEFKQKPMRPLIYFTNKDDEVQLIYE